LQISLLSIKPSANPVRQVDWDKASSEYGAASVESYKKGMQNTTKKIKKAMESGEPEAVEATPAKKGDGGKKRKENAAEAEGEAEESPTKKKKGGRKTKAQKEAEAAAAAAAAEEGEDGAVKAEDDEE
jgi:hypothetical protein